MKLWTSGKTGYIVKLWTRGETGYTVKSLFLIISVDPEEAEEGEESKEEAAGGTGF